MPLLRVITNVAADKAACDAFVKKCSASVAKCLSKPESYFIFKIN